ncbi:MAG: carboxypeptidase-like regulatory domain-containing protein [Planctomycetota bacterium]
MLALFTGCGGDASVAPVEGTIRLNGQPLAGARINTQPIGSDNDANPGVGSFATTDDDGHYELELVQPARPGAIVGTHRVRIKQQKVVYREDRPDAPTLLRSPLPRSASNGSLRLEVPPAGIENADFDLVSE